jgi:hypothetical protein
LAALAIGDRYWRSLLEIVIAARDLRAPSALALDLADRP